MAQVWDRTLFPEGDRETDDAGHDVRSSPASGRRRLPGGSRRGVGRTRAYACRTPSLRHGRQPASRTRRGDQRRPCVGQYLRSGCGACGPGRHADRGFLGRNVYQRRFLPLNGARRGACRRNGAQTGARRLPSHDPGSAHPDVPHDDRRGFGLRRGRHPYSLRRRDRRGRIRVRAGAETPRPPLR